MSLLNQVANREVFDFLRTLTVKSTYFAERSRELQINPRFAEFTPDTANPYVVHLAGEYILNNSDIREEGVDRWFRGFCRTKDLRVMPNKNYWRRDGAHLTRLSREEISLIEGSPKSNNWYETQQIVFENITNPVTGAKEHFTMKCSQLIYDSDGDLTKEVLNSDLFTNGFDEVMMITSLDTGEQIPFCLEMFYKDAACAAGRYDDNTGLGENSIHVKTLEAYRLPGRYFDLLCERYPKQVDLIKAIVYRVPVREISSLITIKEVENLLRNTGKFSDAYITDLKRRYPNQRDLLRIMCDDLNGSKVLNSDEYFMARRTRIAKAKNFDLLAYDDSRLDSYERNDMREFVVKTLNIFRDRWAVNEYNFEENYAAVLWTVLWSTLPLACIARRYANAKTPNVSLSHMWDYLASKGLGEYRGYLSEKNVWFLYKNIEYLFQHQAQQKNLDILVDNILADYGLTLKSKTVVLETTDSLKKDKRPSDPRSQCEMCARNGVSCFKNDKEHLCDEFLGTKKLCKAEPIVLTEDFIGATKDQIIRLLIKNYGYDEDAALVKYRRSFIWRDDDIEKIRNDLNRDQMVDLSGRTETLDQVIKTEHDSGQEPIYSDAVVEEQTKQLQHMHGTYAPTKLLELHKVQYNVRYSGLFNRFITDTFLRFAPSVVVNGDTRVVTKKVQCDYKFTTAENSTTYVFTFGEMMAAGYLGFVREFEVDAVIDKIASMTDPETGLPVPIYDEHTSEEPIDYDINGKPIYRKTLKEWARQYFTDLEKKIDYKFPIPNTCKTTTAIRFGTPVLQDTLYTLWQKKGEKTPEEEQLLLKVSNDMDRTARIITIKNKNTGREIQYAVRETQMTEDWEYFPISLEILGQFTFDKRGLLMVPTYHENNGEIPLIPKYFKWYYNHLNPDFELTPTEREKFRKDVPIAQKGVKKIGQSSYTYQKVESNALTEDDADQLFSISEEEKKKQMHQPYKEVQVGKLYIDESTNTFFRVFTLSQFLNVEDLLDRWVDVMGTITDQSTISSYIDNMFSILEDVYTFASASGSIRTNVACREFLDRIIVQKKIRFDLTGIRESHDVSDGSLCAYFSDWLNLDPELSASLSLIDRLKDAKAGWNEFNMSIVRTLLEGCTIEYARETIDRILYEKLKKLVLDLSSYKITIIDHVEDERVCNIVGGIAEDALLDKITDREIIYFDPIGDSIAGPRVGGYQRQLDELGYILAPTTDLRRQKDKTYYQLIVRDSKIYENHNPNFGESETPKRRPLAHVGSEEPGQELMGTRTELIDVPDNKVWFPVRLTSDVFILNDKTYYKYDSTKQMYEAAKVADYTAVRTRDVTEEIPPNALHGTDESGDDIVYSAIGFSETVEVGDRLPPGRCFERLDLYAILGVEKGTPLLISKIGTQWFYSTGTIGLGTVKTPGSYADINDPCLDQDDLKAGDRFDLHNDFSNEYNKQFFDSVVYRLNIPVEKIEWSDPTPSLDLANALLPTISREHYLTEDVIKMWFMETVIPESEMPKEEEVNS